MCKHHCSGGFELNAVRGPGDAPPVAEESVRTLDTHSCGLEFPRERGLEVNGGVGARQEWYSTGRAVQPSAPLNSANSVYTRNRDTTQGQREADPSKESFEVEVFLQVEIHIESQLKAL